MTVHLSRRGALVLSALAAAATTRAVADTDAYKPQPGPFAVRAANPLVFRLADQDKDLQLRLTYPDGLGPFPVVAFSHGALSSKDLYNRVADHWASHGYAVALPTHLDSESLGYSFRNPLPREQVFFGRIQDMQFIFANLDAIAAKAGVPGALDAGRMAVAGHSFGGWIALIMAGLPVTMPDGSLKSFAEPRLKALVSYNGIGQMAGIPEEGWARVTLPVFAASGTHDPGATGDGVARPWRWRMGAYDLTAAREKYAVSIVGGDHYYGGLICRDTAPGPQDVDGLAIVNGVSTAFLDAYVKGDGAAKRFLKTADLRTLTADRGFLERL
jgi:predicted dienelactone hydrolase